MDIGFVQELYKVEAARSRGEQISEFKIARLYVDSMWIEMAEILDSGIPKSDLVGMLMITARVGRAAAYNTLTNKINSVDNRKAKVKSEVSKESGAKQKVSPVPALKPVQSVPAKPAPAPALATSAPTESSQEPVFKGSIRVGNNNFLGIDDVGKRAEQEREERRRSQASLAAMEEKYGAPIDLLKQHKEI